MYRQSGQGFCYSWGTPSLEFPFLTLKGLLVSIFLGFYTDVQEHGKREELEKGYFFLVYLQTSQKNMINDQKGEDFS